MFTYVTAGESHGKMLTAIIKKVPAGLELAAERINRELARRQQGYGRGGRMKIEHDHVEITSGVRNGITLGSPIALQIMNRDWENWQSVMAVENSTAGSTVEPETRPRPGHADLTGAIKYHTHDLRNILERASARETAIRTAVGAVCRCFLEEFGVSIWSHVVQIGDVMAPGWEQVHSGLDGQSQNAWLHVCKDAATADQAMNLQQTTQGSMHSEQQALHDYFTGVEASPLRCGNPVAEASMIALIDRSRGAGDSVGGVFELVVTGLPVGLGSYIQWDERLDGKLAQALMSIQGIKGVEFGLGFRGAGLPGSMVHDPIYYQSGEGGGRFYRPTNYAGGLEGGMTNGELLIIRVAMKPIPTLMSPLHSVDLLTKEAIFASKERADVCAVPAASIVGEAVAATVLARAFVDKFGGDSLHEIRNHFEEYQAYVREF